MHWYKVFGNYKRIPTEKLYMGDVLARNATSAKNKAIRKYPKWNVTSVRLTSSTVTKSDRMRYGAY